MFYGTWKNHPVAVKIFIDNEAAIHEAALYYNYHLRHENVLCNILFTKFIYIIGFISADNFNLTGPTQYWLIFDFHPNLSLYDFLNDCEHFYNIPNINQVKNLGNILISMCAGLKYLHSEIIGHGIIKPRICHRDVKSKNILIKSDGMCCIADLGMSIVETFDNNHSEDNDNESISYSPFFENTFTESHFLSLSHSSQALKNKNPPSPTPLLNAEFKMCQNICNNKVNFVKI